MPKHEFVVANLAEHRAELLAINTEYMTWVLAEMGSAFGIPADTIAGMTPAQYVAKGIHKICSAQPPQGVFYLLKVEGEVGGELAGMCGLRQLSADSSTAELKRIYVRPAFRGRQLGALALERLLADARSFGYRSACLDSAPFMQAAQQLYAAHGFVDCPAYAGTEVAPQFHAKWRFMRRDGL
jgi:GNAT superfamily N-acetyltransferase